MKKGRRKITNRTNNKNTYKIVLINTLKALIIYLKNIYNSLIFFLKSFYFPIVEY
jgi:hypothetical protein